NGGGIFTDISGQTSSPLTLNSPAVSQSGNQYRAVFTNGCGTATSTAATLTVNAKALAVTGITANNKVYDGGTSATLNIGTATLNGVVSGDTITLNTGSSAGAFVSKTVGTGKTVNVSGL